MKSENFGCKNCGSMMRFDAEEQVLKCENCGNIEKIISMPTNIKHKFFEYEKNLNIQNICKTTVECSSCGASVEFDNYETSKRCPYCDSNVVISEKLLSVLEIDGIRPFIITVQKTKKIFEKWVKGKWFAPNALKNLYQSGKTIGIYLPFWTFDNDADCRYMAQGGRDRIETYEKDGKTYTRTVTDWYDVRGFVDNHFEDEIVFATDSIKNNLMTEVSNFATMSSVKFDSKYLAGYKSEIFKVPMISGYETAKMNMRDYLENLVAQDVLRSYDHVRGIMMDIDWYNEYYRLLMLPVYSTSYSFNGNTYQVVINGETGQIVGEYPKSFWKILIVIIIVILVLFCLYKYLQ